MRIHVVSDLHQEFGIIDIPTVDCDCVVLAGDVSTKRNGLAWILRRFRDVPVIYVCGNHEFFASHDPERSVVITHHAPSALSLPESRRPELISCAYASRMDEFLLKHQPRLWLQGHIHHSSDYRIGNTRVLANPRAYPDYPNPGFIADLTLDLESVDVASGL
jgi:Icc-related predicted phosphoesterase